MKHLAWKQIIIAFAAAFVIGTIFGRWEYAEQMKHKWRKPEARQAWVLKRLDSKLELNPDQKEKISAILKESAPEMAAARAEMWPKIEAVRDQVREKIMPILTPEQQKKYDDMETEWRERKRMKMSSLK